MAAKKAPAKKMTAPKKTASAADFRMKEEADKAASYNKNPDKNARDARGRSTKYGTPVGPTTKTDMGKPFKSSPNTRFVKYTTTVVKNGVRYAVVESKEINKMLPDKRSTSVTKNKK